jgi:hypothetical protein
MKTIIILIALFFTACTPYANFGTSIPIGKIGNSNINLGIDANGKLNLDLGGGIRISR